MSFVYKRTEPGLWTVGFYDGDGKWEPESDHSSALDASEQAAWLNGSPRQPAEPVEADGTTFLLWSNKHGRWWKAGGWGYTIDVGQAGRFNRDEAVKYVVQSAYHARLDQVSCMIVAPAHHEATS